MRLCNWNSAGWPDRNERAENDSRQEHRKTDKKRPPANSGRAKKKYKEYLDVLTVHTYNRNIPMASKGFIDCHHKKQKPIIRAKKGLRVIGSASMRLAL